MRSASRRARSSISGATRRSCTITSAPSSRRAARSVSSSGSPGPAPTSATLPRAVPAARSRSSSSGSRSSPAAGSSSRSSVPSNTCGQKPSHSRRRWSRLGSRAVSRSRTRPAASTSGPSRGGSKASMRARNWRTSTGAWPPLAMATSSGSRSTMAGKVTLHSAGRSTTFTSTPRPAARPAMRALSASSSVAATTSAVSSRSAGSKPR